MSKANSKAAMDDHIIRMINLNKWYGNFHVLKDINLNVKQGERIVICGPSGSGKTTLIRCINHLEEHVPCYLTAGAKTGNPRIS